MRLLPLIFLLAPLANGAPHAQASGDQASGALPRSVLIVDAASGGIVEGLAPEAVSAQPGAGALLVMGAAGMVASFALIPLAEEVPGVLFLAPVASGVAVYAAGGALGHDGDLLRTMGGAALGAVPGLVLIGIGAEVDRRGDGDALLGEGFGLIVLGALAYMTVPSMGASVGYATTPAVLTTPEGEPVPGLSLSIGL